MLLFSVLHFVAKFFIVVETDGSLGRVEEWKEGGLISGENKATQTQMIFFCKLVIWGIYRPT